MQKSVYSLVLADDVVAAVDRLAYQQGTSRSNMINQILASHCSFVTPEKRRRDIFSLVEDLFSGGSGCFKVQLQPSDSMLSIQSALAYKYKPSIRYAVELYHPGEAFMGELRVSFRTQSRQLIATLSQFYRLWEKLENAYVGNLFPGGQVSCQVQDERFYRKLLPPKAQEGVSEQEAGEAIAGYIKAFDHGLKTFFAHLENPPAALSETEKAYLSYLRGGSPVI